MLLTQALIIGTLVGMALYYRRNRLPMLVGNGSRLPRQLLGLAGVLLLALAWSLMGSAVNQSPEPGVAEQTPILNYVAMAVLAALGIGMLGAALRASFDQVIALLDYLTLYRRRR